MGEVIDIEARAKANDAFRRVLVTGGHSQIVLMAIPPGSEIGEEVHDHIDQTIVVVDGEGRAVLDGQRESVGSGGLVFIPAGTRHNVVNTGPQPLRLYTIYAPPEHAPGTVHQTIAQAAAAHAAEEG